MSWRLHSYDRLGSTQDLCIQLAQAGEAEGLAIRAGLQTAGRGSRGRTWQDSGGNLALSVLLRPVGPASDVGQWALLAGLALLEALQDHAPAGPLRLKWPNDVRLGSDKVAGVLLDSAASDRDRLDWLVVGFGANLAQAPDLPDTAALGIADVAAVAGAVLARLDHWRSIRRLDGFAPIRRQWLVHAHAVGTLLRVRGGGLDIAGQFAGLADSGALLLATGGRVHAVDTGEILQAGA